jgi:cell division protein ZipA
MEDTVRYILLLIGIIVILFILWDGLRRKKKTAETSPVFTLDLRKLQQKNDNDKDKDEDEVNDGIIGEVKVIPNANPVVLPAKVPGKLRPSTLKNTAPVLKSFQKLEALKQAKDPQESSETPKVQKQEAEAANEPETSLREGKFIVLNIQAKPGKFFGGYRLLQILLAHGFQFGTKGFFHRHVSLDPKSKILFSLSSSIPPGTFDPTKMGNFECNGLVLFMNVAQHEYPEKVFDEMHEMAKALAETLDGELQVTINKPCHANNIAEIKKVFKKT